MRLFRRRLVRIAMITTLLASAAAVVAATSPAASAAPTAAKDGWVRIAHLSPQARPWTCTCIRSAIPATPLC